MVLNGAKCKRDGMTFCQCTALKRLTIVEEDLKPKKSEFLSKNRDCTLGCIKFLRMKDEYGICPGHISTLQK